MQLVRGMEKGGVQARAGCALGPIVAPRSLCRMHLQALNYITPCGVPFVETIDTGRCRSAARARDASIGEETYAVRSYRHQQIGSNICELLGAIGSDETGDCTPIALDPVWPKHKQSRGSCPGTIFPFVCLEVAATLETLS